jgi:hypothetical protein
VFRDGDERREPWHLEFVWACHSETISPLLRIRVGRIGRRMITLLGDAKSKE